jgi:hypothetical protein
MLADMTDAQKQIRAVRFQRAKKLHSSKGLKLGAHGLSDSLPLQMSKRHHSGFLCLVFSASSAPLRWAFRLRYRRVTEIEANIAIRGANLSIQAQSGNVNPGIRLRIATPPDTR